MSSINWDQVLSFDVQRLIGPAWHFNVGEGSVELQSLIDGLTPEEAEAKTRRNAKSVADDPEALLDLASLLYARIVLRDSEGRITAQVPISLGASIYNVVYKPAAELRKRRV